MNLELLLFCVLIWLAGFIGRLVDAHHEHGLNFFPHAGLLFAVLTGLLWSYVMTRSAILLTGFMGLVFFWIYKLAWDCVNHAIILILILLFALNSDYRIDSAYAVAILFAHGLFHHLKNVTPSLRWQGAHEFFYKYRLDFLLIPLGYSLLVGPQGFVIFLPIPAYCPRTRFSIFPGMSYCRTQKPEQAKDYARSSSDSHPASQPPLFAGCAAAQLTRTP